MTRQRNKFANFILSLFPGAGHMFQGFLKCGISFTFYAACSIALLATTQIVLFIIPFIIVYVYSFFDSMQRNWLPPEEFQTLSDEYFLPDGVEHKMKSSNKAPQIVGVALLLIGILVFIDNIGMRIVYTLFERQILSEETFNLIHNVWRDAPTLFVCLLSILVGIRLIRGKKRELLQQGALDAEDPSPTGGTMQ